MSDKTLFRIIKITICIAIIMLFCALLASCGNAPAKHSDNKPATGNSRKLEHVTTPVILTLPQQVQKAGCTDFKDLGHGGLVKDSGKCYIKGQQYGADSFNSQAERNSWLAIATEYGVVPEWESATAVLYPSVSI